ncbi:MAG: glucuronate isomerase [Bacteroidetes bacterium]|nr:glucuronate isomerase [Bacteroidota bacterium]
MPILSDDRYFGPGSELKFVANELFNKISELPIISPHGHIDPAIFLPEFKFGDPVELFITPDHYVFRMLYSQGIDLADLGIDNNPKILTEDEKREIWQILGDNFHLFLGTPSGCWLTYEFSKIFGFEERLNGSNAQKLYDKISEKIEEDSFVPSKLMKEFNINLITTTDPAYDSLDTHSKILKSKLDFKIIPSFRPDKLFQISSKEWKNELEKLSSVTKSEINNFNRFICALEKQREYFKSHGAVATDHGIEEPYTGSLTHEAVEIIFNKALKDCVSKEEEKLFQGHMLMEMARMSCEDGLVMQLHAGCFRNHNFPLFEKYGWDKGADLPVKTEFTNNLYQLLNKYGNNKNFTLILFTMDESTYSRELAPLAGHYPALKLGPAWWFHDSIQGMTRYRKSVTETAGFFNTAGFNDDTRAFLSIPARHDLSRRMDCNFLAELVLTSQITIEEAEMLAYELTNGLVKKAYKL